MKSIKGVVVVALVIMLIPRVTWSLENDGLLVDALSASGANPQMMDIVDWSVINREFIDFSQMEQYGDEILSIFAGKKEFFKSTEENSEKYRILITEGMLDPDTFLQIIVQSVILPEEFEKEPQTYLVVNISGQNLKNFVDLTEKVREAVISSGGQSKISSCVTGTFDGKLNGEKQDKILKNIYGYLKISDTEKIKDEYTFSMMGFTPLLSEGVQILGKNYNIHIAMRYNSEEDRTYIWIGTPIISLEY